MELDFPNKEKIKLIYNKWRLNDYMMYGEQYQKGFEATTGDWVIKADIDYFFHEDDWDDIRMSLEVSNDDVLYMEKRQLILTNKYKTKALLPIIFRGSLRGRVRFDSGLDYTYPRVDSKIVSDKNKVLCRKSYVVVSDNVTEEQITSRLPERVGQENMYCMVNRIPFYNYDFTFKDKKTIARDYLKQSKAKYIKTGSHWGLTKSEALKVFTTMQLGKLKSKGWIDFPVEKQPKHIQEKIRNLKPEQLGYNIWGLM